MIAGYKSDEIIKITGITYRQLDYWTSKGLITPEINAGGSSGIDRLYSLKNIFDISVVKYLKQHNLTFEDISEIIKRLKFMPFPHSFKDIDILVIDNKSIVFLKDGIDVPKEFATYKHVKNLNYLTPERIAKVKTLMIVIPTKKITKEIIKVLKKMYKLESENKDIQIKAIDVRVERWEIDNIRRRLAELIGKANHKVSMTSSNLDSTFWNSGEVIQALKKANEKGIDIEIAFSGKIDEESTFLKKLVKEEKVILYHTSREMENHFMTVDRNYLYFEKPHLPKAIVREAICGKNRILGKNLEDDFKNMTKQAKRVESNSPLLN